MKRLLTFFIGFALILSLAGCSFNFSLGGNDSESDSTDKTNAVSEPIQPANNADTSSPDETEKPSDTSAADNTSAADDTSAEQPPQATNYITIDSPENESDFHEEPITFTGVVSPNTEKIVVTATITSNVMMDSVPTSDVYTLQDFKPGDTTFSYRAKMDWNNLTYGTNEYEFKAYYDDGSTKTANITVYFSPATAEMGKPVIYLYPDRTMKVSVNVEPEDGISVSEPELNDGWKVVATPESKIYNFGDASVYPYLFWEGYAHDFVTPDQGFVVNEDDIATFFDDKLAVLGLNDKEISDFKEFWVPRLNEKPYYFITFIPQEDFDNYAPLTVDPAPDSVIRVFFDYKGLDKRIEVKEQNLATPDRKGFTVVEWGGRLY